MSSDLPALSDLGADLLKTSRWQRWQPMGMPYLYAACFLAAVQWKLWWGCAASLVMLFSACSTSAHDVLHGSLGLSRRSTEILLFLLGLPVLESGHAYRATHLKHHKSFPAHDDIEGEAAHQSIWVALVTGPFFLPRLWLWAVRHRKEDRVWLAIEAFILPVALILGWTLRPVTPAPFAYVVTVYLSSWFYPVFAVNLPHRNFEEERLKQAWTTRGRFIPKLFLPLAYHLEHHLYPKVPSHNLPELARRLEPYLLEHGVTPIRVP